MKCKIQSNLEIIVICFSKIDTNVGFKAVMWNWSLYSISKMKSRFQGRIAELLVISSGVIDVFLLLFL